MGATGAYGFQGRTQDVYGLLARGYELPVSHWDLNGWPVSRCPSFGPAFFLIPLLLLSCPRLQSFRLLIILPMVTFIENTA